MVLSTMFTAIGLGESLQPFKLEFHSYSFAFAGVSQNLQDG
jgi:hypothetical protein